MDDYALEFDCEYLNVTERQHSIQVKEAPIIKIEQELVLDSSVLPAPTICVESSSNSDIYNCDAQPQLCKKTKLDFENSFNFRIDSIWLGQFSGEKRIQLVNDGCAIMPTDLVEADGRSFEWDTFRFRDSTNVFFNIKLTMCDPNDAVYCNGSTDCAVSQGNKFLFEELMNMTTTTTSTTLIPENTYIMVILSSLSDSFIINGDGSTRTAAQISGPGNVNGYTHDAQSAVVADKLYIFGGQTSDRRKIARLESCTIVELTVKLNNDYAWGHALATADNSQALICFGNNSPWNYCDIFDGSTVVTTFSTTYSHSFGGLAHYNAIFGALNCQPTTVGSWYSDGFGKVETLAQNGWTSLADHQTNVRGHNLVALENGDLLLIGGYDDDYPTLVWRLSNDTWTEEETLQKAMAFGSSIKVNNQIYLFPGLDGNSDNGEFPIQRLDLANDSTIEQVELIGNNDEYFMFPILYITDANTCTNN
ncbi:unnamed protein product [Oikopleura dioica]|uniref:Uncharacterized protein n=1 Tax=Oikopleura dioica TaxID=34765 RepID=E4X1J4_OIKDI|nr:unnamed protein product [Oikopleura dioica]